MNANHSTLPGPDRFVKYWHHAFEVRPDAVAALRQAIEPACCYGDFRRLESLVATYGGTGLQRIQWFQEDAGPPQEMVPSPEGVLRLCLASDAVDFGMRGSGTLMGPCLDVGTALLPPLQAGRHGRWEDLALDVAFEAVIARADELLARWPTHPPSGWVDAWHARLESWFEEQEASHREAEYGLGPLTPGELADRTVAVWSAILDESFLAYRRVLEALAKRDGYVMTRWLPSR